MKPTRRGFLAGTVAMVGGCAVPPASSRPFPLSLCHETFKGMSFPDAIRAARRVGYTGIEVTTAALSDDPASLSASRRKELRSVLESEGVTYVGLHRLLSTPKGLHLTTPDEAVRRRTWDYLRRLIDLAADLGPGAVMVLGASRERSTTGGASVRDAVSRLTDGLAAVAPPARDRGVTILLEPLAPRLSDVVNTVAEAVAIVEAIGSPSISSMFDTHNAPAETLPHGEVIRRNIRHLRHVHLNEMDGRHPGAGDYDFRPVLQALRDVRYGGWVSVEPFDFTPGGERVAKDSYDHVRRLEASLG
jgi:D-psicose/D-tagatose/L-ribulose 3-epimerase